MCFITSGIWEFDEAVIRGMTDEKLLEDITAALNVAK